MMMERQGGEPATACSHSRTPQQLHRHATTLNASYAYAVKRNSRVLTTPFYLFHGRIPHRLALVPRVCIEIFRIISDAKIFVTLDVVHEVVDHSVRLSVQSCTETYVYVIQLSRVV